MSDLCQLHTSGGTDVMWDRFAQVLAPEEEHVAPLTTNAAGNGSAFHVFSPADAEGLRCLTVGGIWTLMNGSMAAYTTTCATVRLD